MNYIIKSKLIDYLEIDINNLTQLNTNTIDYLVFGGCLRDLIRDGYIKNDVDILCKPKAFQIITDILVKNGWKLTEMSKKDINALYNGIHIINEPLTLYKNNKFIQLIKPAGSDIFKFEDVISNVDISCCGISYDGHHLYENIRGAINDCKNSVFRVFKNVAMYQNNRIYNRIEKHLNYGYKQYDSNRVMNLNLILNECRDIEYIKCYSNNAKNNYELDINYLNKIF